MRVVASIEARMGSSRLPGKVLADVQGKPALSRLLARLRCCKRLDDIVLATTVSPSDDALALWAEKEGVAIHRGSEDDVLQRVVNAQKQMRSDLVVEITGDCILIDPEVVDLGVDTYLANHCDVATNTDKLTFPQGDDVQVFRLELLEHVANTIHDPAVREHVSLYFYDHPEKYRILNIIAPARWHGPDLRFQLDYEEDLRFIREIYGILGPKFGDAFGTEEIMALLRSHPDLVAINRHCTNKPVR